ncbi:unnamed protein product [Chondrus crispus]|uniref:Uncharacterized protein n=1 Tax=Chondrus crispus TaxID=2769 RepID=R7QPR4_CHOCR|nr:unnamed protein product [Chondrus crispus]CDF39773.1 unnamed protein product [Chondrus crispus]|eukprot:XP_005710067.1 unnamed protein product [Chondrus crispus]
MGGDPARGTGEHRPLGLIIRCTSGSASRRKRKLRYSTKPQRLAPPHPAHFWPQCSTRAAHPPRSITESIAASTMERKRKLRYRTPCRCLTRRCVARRCVARRCIARRCVARRCVTRKCLACRGGITPSHAAHLRPQCIPRAAHPPRNITESITASTME